MRRVSPLLLTMLLAAACSAGQARPPSPPDRGHELQQRLLQAVRDAEAAGFSGAALVVREGQVLLDDAVGAVHGNPMRPGSRFRIASAGKQFTSAALLRCAERGLLSLDSPLSSLLPDVPADKRAITPRQLLSYTSGIPSADDGESAASAAEAARAVLALPLEAAPGERFVYATGNYLLAAAIVEKVSGTAFPELVRREVLEPAGLDDTGQAIGPGDHGIAPLAGDLPPRLRDLRWSALAYYSTTRDLARWVEALASGRVLSRASLDALLSPVVRIKEGHAALGWFVGASPRGTRRIFTRGNEDMGANSSVYWYPDRRTVIVVLTHGGDTKGGVSWSRALQGELESRLGL